MAHSDQQDQHPWSSQAVPTAPGAIVSAVPDDPDATASMPINALLLDRDAGRWEQEDVTLVRRASDLAGVLRQEDVTHTGDELAEAVAQVRQELARLNELTQGDGLGFGAEPLPGPPEVAPATTPSQAAFDPFAVTGLRLIEQAEPAPEAQDFDPLAASGIFVLDEDMLELIDGFDGDDLPLDVAAGPMTLDLEHGEIIELMDPDVLDESDIELLDDELLLIEEQGTQERAPAQEMVPELSRPVIDAREIQRQLRGQLDVIGGRLELRPPWGRVLSDLRQELVAEPDSLKRAAYLYLAIFVLRLHGEAGEVAAKHLEFVGEQLLPRVRPMLLHRLALAWDQDDKSFMQVFDALRRQDQRAGLADATRRHASIARVRVLRDLLHHAPGAELELALAQDAESVESRAVLALAAHRAGRHRQAAAIWGELTASLSAHDAAPLSTLISLSGGGGAQGVGALASAWHGVFEAHRSCDLEAQTVAQERVIGIARRERAEAELMAAALTRHGYLLQRAREDGRGAAMMLREAIRISPQHLGAARQLERIARRADDPLLLVEALRTQLEATQDPNLRALVQEQLACALERTEASEEQVRAPLEHALRDAHDCLPALITLGHLAQRADDPERLARLRERVSIGEAATLSASWRQADALERVGADPRQLVALYRDAAQHEPQDLHLFWGLERALARQGQWKGVDALYERVDRAGSELGAQLDACGLSTGAQRAALQAYLLSGEELAPARARAHWSRLGQRLGGEPEAAADEPIFWRIIAADAQEGSPDDVLRRLDAALEQTSGASTHETLRARALLWKVYILGWKLKRTRQTQAPWRQLFDLLKRPMMRRFAMHGLLRVGDEGWIADRWRADRLLANELMELLQVPRPQQKLFTRGFAAELLARVGRADEAFALLDEIEHKAQDVREREQWRERGLAMALRERRWERAYTALSAPERQTSPTLLVQLSACLDDPRPLEILPDSTRDAARALTELEVLLRRRDWTGALELADEVGRAAWSAHDGPVRELFEVLSALIAEWGVGDLAQAARRASSAQHATQAHMREVALGMRYRIARRQGQDVRAQQLLDELEVRFGASARPFFERAAQLADGPLDALERWVHEQAGRTGELARHARVVAGLFGWLFGKRDALAIKALDAAGEELPDELVLQVVRFAARRHAGQHAFAERQLRALCAQHRSSSVRQWAEVRLIFHLAMNVGEPEDALSMLEEQPSWSQRGPHTLRGLLERGLRRPHTSWMEHLDQRAGWALLLERAELNVDADTQHHLATHFVPGACLLVELRAAYERRDWRPDHHVEVRHASLRQALLQGQDDAARQHLIALLEACDAALIDSPWCPLRLAAHDLRRLAATPAARDALVTFAQNMEPRGVGSALRLRVAAYLSQIGEPARARTLIPTSSAPDTLDGRAWVWMAHALRTGDMERDGRALELLLHFWRRAQSQTDAHKDLLAVEVGRTLESLGQRDQALALYEDVLGKSPGSGALPLRIAYARQLISRQLWGRLAALWTRELEWADQPGERIGRAFRLAYLYERRLSQRDVRAIERAAALYHQVLEIQPNHLPSLHAALRLADWLGRPADAARHLATLIELCMDRQLKATYHAELAVLCEQELDEPARALEHYQAALVLAPEDQTAFWGILRTDDPRRDETLRVIEARMAAARNPQTRDMLADLAMVLAPEHPRTLKLMQRHQPEDRGVVLMRLVQHLGRGLPDEEAMRQTAGLFHHEGLRAVFAWLGDPNRRELDFELEDEGAWIAHMARALREQDAGTMEHLSQTLIASSSLSTVERVAEKTRSAMLLRWGGRRFPATEYCQQALTAHPDFVPLIRLARQLATELPNWKLAAELAEREARHTRDRALARRARLEASDIYRRYLSDLPSAMRLLQEVLNAEPDHQRAYETLHEMYMAAGQIEQALRLTERRLPYLATQQERVEQLNHMADLALAHLSDKRFATTYLAESIKLHPGQLRRLRVLAELYEELGQLDQAALCYEGAIQLSGDPRLTSIMTMHLAQLYMQRLGRLDAAERTYARLIHDREHGVEATTALMRIREQRGDALGALELLDELERRVTSHEEILQVRLARLHLFTRGELPRQGLEREARRVLSLQPLHQDTARMLQDHLSREGRANELGDVARRIALESFAEQVHPPYPGLFALARGWGQGDLAYNLCSVSVWTRQATFEMMAVRESSGMTTRWPRSPIPLDLTRGLLPEDLSLTFFEVVRRTQEALLEACNPVPYSPYLKRRLRIANPANEMMAQAWRWPQLMGLELRDVTLTDRLPMGSAVIWDNGVRLLLDRQWKEVRDPAMLLVRLGTQLAAWAMGIGYWTSLERPAQVALFEHVIRQVVPGWGITDGLVSAPSWLHSGKLDQWMRAHVDDLVAPYALEISGRLDPTAISHQFLLLELAMERLACVIMPDIAQVLDHTIRLREDRGPGKRQWAFLFTSTVARIREAVGVAYHGAMR